MPYFRDIAPATLRRLAPLFSTRLAKRDTHIIREGEEGSVLYVLAQGAASIQKWSSDRKCFVEVAKITEDSDHTYFGARAPTTPTVAACRGAPPPSPLRRAA